MKPRMLCWFSCGVPSAVASKICVDELSASHEVLIVNCDTKSSEHPDNYRFFNEVQAWLGVKIIEIRSKDYKRIEEVAEKTRWMSGPKGARCTTELKKIPRLNFARPDDIHVFGMTVGERKRMRDFEQRNPDMIVRWILAEKNITRAECDRRIKEAGIRRPMMYELGFDNNNCPGCFKGSSPWYWDMVRKHFPVIFQARCVQSRELGCKLVEIRHHVRIFLDELPPGPFKKRAKKERMSCGPECGIQTNLL